MLLGGKRSGEMNAGVSFEKVDCPTRSVSGNIALLEDKELATDLFLVTASTQMQFSEDFWVWLHKPEMVTMVTH